MVAIVYPFPGIHIANIHWHYTTKADHEQLLNITLGLQNYTYCPVVVSGQKESAEETMRDNDSVLTTPPLLYVSVEGLKESRHSVIHICTTKTERGRERKIYIKWVRRERENKMIACDRE